MSCLHMWDLTSSFYALASSRLLYRPLMNLPKRSTPSYRIILLTWRSSRYPSLSMYSILIPHYQVPWICLVLELTSVWGMNCEGSMSISYCIDIHWKADMEHLVLLTLYVISYRQYDSILSYYPAEIKVASVPRLTSIDWLIWRIVSMWA